MTAAGHGSATSDSPLVALRSRTGAALIAATVLASATTAVDANVIKVAVPAIGRSLHASVMALQWTLTGYLLAVAALLLLAGALSDRFGRGRLLAIGLLVMLVASVLCAVAPSIGVLIVARVIQGIGAALVVPTSLALINGTLRDGDRARGIGIWAGLETLGTTAGPSSGWLSAPVLVAGAFGVIGLALLVPAERGLRAPMLRLSLFVSRQFDAINVMTLVLYGALGAASYLVILQCELRLGYSAAQAGAALIPESVVFLVLAPVSGALVARAGPRWLMTGGTLAVAAAFCWLSAAHAGESYAAAILPGALLWGIGIGLAVTPLTAAVLAAVGDADLGEASGINDAASRIGGVVVVAVVPALIGATGGRSYARALTHGYQPAMIVMGGLCAAAALITAVFVTNTRPAAHRIVPRAPEAGCAACVPLPATTPDPAPVPAAGVTAAGLTGTGLTGTEVTATGGVS